MRGSLVQSALEDIKKSLADNSCSCFVGAGFSKNAVRDYPDWYQLLYKMVEEIYEPDYLERKKLYKGHKVSNDEIKDYIIKEKGVLAVPEDYEHFHGKREYLDNYIDSAICAVDKNTKDFTLHKKFLQLGWNDVITTNWDGLFEEVNQQFLDNNDAAHQYTMVYEAKGLATAAHRRIVKIHGSVHTKTYKEKYFDNSFRHRFVVSKSDFENYKEEHDDFDNFMKVAFLQNTFCLFGFSGDDPNFQYWIRALRRTMTKGGNTKASRKIYLFSYKPKAKIAKPDLQFYENNNIDLICLEDVEKYLQKLPKNKFTYNFSFFPLTARKE